MKKARYRVVRYWAWDGMQFARRSLRIRLQWLHKKQDKLPLKAAVYEIKDE